MPSVYKIIRTEREVKQLIQHCKTTGYASVDFETNAVPVNHPVFYPTILSVSFQVGSGWVIPLGHFDSPFKKNWKKVFRMFCKEVIENKDILKVAQNAKFEYTIFKKYGYEMKGRVFDTMLAKYLLDEERPMGLKPMVDRFIPEFAGYSEDYEGHKLPWDQKPLEGLSKYGALDSDLTLRLMLFFEPILIKEKFYNLFRNMLMMGTRVLGDSQYMGMYVDEPYLDDLDEIYQVKIANKDKEIRAKKKINKFQKWLVEKKTNKLISKCNEEINQLGEVIEDLKIKCKAAKDPKEIKKIVSAINRKYKSIEGREDKVDRYIARDFTTKKELECLEPVNFKSPPQLVDLLFLSPEGFQFEIIKYTTDKQKNETDTPSTDESVLEELVKKDKTGFCKALLEYRGMTKIYSTYVKGIKEKVINSKVHSRFKLEGTVTGRLSSTEPNLQNIPRDLTAGDIKEMFKPPKGYLLLQLDYSQAELRVMAAMAGEETMIKWFKEGKDIHITTALKMYHQEDKYDEIKKIIDSEDDSDEYKLWKGRRKYAKTINFGVIYGQGAPKLADALGWTVQEAKQFLHEYFRTFPKIKKFIESQHYKVYRDGYVRNIFGRKRRLYKIDSSEKWEVAEAERQSVNAPIQGAASDYTLFSSIIIWEEARKGNILLDYPQVYTVHDSLGYYVHPTVVHEVVPKMQAICANPQTKDWFGFQIDDVTMKVDFEVSHESWGKLKTYDPSFDYQSLY